MELSFDEAKNQVSSVSNNYIKFGIEKTKIRSVSNPFLSFRHRLEDPTGKVLNPACPNEGKRPKLGVCPICDELLESPVSPDEYQERGARKVLYMLVIDRTDGQIKILDKMSIIKTIVDHSLDEDWGNPKEYDFTVTKEGTGMATKYTTVASPKKSPLTDEELKMIESCEIDLERMTTPDTYENLKKRINGEKVEYEQKESKPVSPDNVDDEIKLSDIPF